MAEEVPTVEALIRLAHAETEADLVARFGAFALVGPGAPRADDLPGFRYATEHAPRPKGVAHPMASLLESVVYGLTKRPGSAFANVLVIGRAPNSDVWIDDAQVSKLHARVTIDPTRGHVLSDAGSANGTFVDDQALAEKEERVLTEGTRVRLGDRPFAVRSVASFYAMLKRFPKPT